MPKRERRTPVLVWLGILALAATEPLAHLWLHEAPPAGMAATGLRTGDSHVYLHSMRAFETDWFSPYASCRAELGAHSWRYYALPVHLFYAVAGAPIGWLGLDYLVGLGLLNGIGAVLYLWAVYRFLREAAPRLANLAFAIFLLGGAPGGLLYGLALAIGAQRHYLFEDYFTRFALYDLMEGSYLWGFLHLTRLYYTAALACAYAALTLFIRSLDTRRPRLLLPAALLMLGAQCVNMRCGTFLFGVAVVYAAVKGQTPRRDRVRALAALAVPIVLGAALTVWLVGFHPSYTANQMSSVHEAMWFSPFVVSIFLHLFVLPIGIGAALKTLPRSGRVVACASVAYLLAFALLYAGYLVYYGEYLRCNDVMSAIFASDWALIGAGLGALLGLAWAIGRGPVAEREAAEATPDTGWVALWFLLFVAIALSTWGDGWFMRFTPRRAMVVIGLPLAILSAAGLLRLHARHPRLAGGWMSALVVLGLSSVSVAALCFQGPLGQTPGKGAFARKHYEVMTRADAEALEALPAGRVLTPMFNPWTFGEVIALRAGNTVVAAVGTFNHSDLLFDPMKDRVNAFFTQRTPDEVRRAFVAEWCVDYVYCPDTCPVNEWVVHELRDTPWLREIKCRGRASLFEVLKS